jgi:alpha-1,6-mannosyltransferase
VPRPVSARLSSPAPWIGLLAAATLAIGVMSGLAASPFLPPLPQGVGTPALLERLARAAGMDRMDPATASLRGAIVMGVAVLAFLGLLLHARRGQIATRTAVLTSLVLIAIVALYPPMLSRDVYSYAIYGRIWAVAGSNPYVHPPVEFLRDPFFHVVSAEWIRSPSVYGPAFTILSGGLVKLFGSPAATIAAFKILAAVALAGSVLIVASLGERRGPGRGAFPAVAVGLNPVLLFHTVGGGHNDVLVGLSVVGALALLPRRPLVATAVLTLGALVKLVAVVPLALLIGAVFLRAGPGLARRVRAAAPHAGLAAGMTLVLLAPFGYSKSVVSAFATLLSRLGWASPVRLVAYKAVDAGANLGSGDLGELFAALAKAGFTALGVLTLILILRRMGRHDPRVSEADAWGWGLLMVSLCAAYLLPWYAAWFIPALALSSREGPLAVGLGVAALLGMTGIPAEPGFDPSTWSGMLLAVHYVIAPIMLGLLVALVLDLRRVLLGRAPG